MIKGENRNFCFGLFKAWQSLNETREHYKDMGTDTPTHPWFGAHQLDPDGFLQGIRPMIKHQLLGQEAEDTNIVYGFKEIRYLDHLDELKAYLLFLQTVFPNPAFIFNIRNHQDVVRSAWWKQMDPHKAKTLLEKTESAFMDFAREHDNAYVNRYETILKGVAGVEDLLSFLGAKLDGRLVEEALATRHGFKLSNTVRAEASGVLHASFAYASKQGITSLFMPIKSVTKTLVARINKRFRPQSQ